MIRFKPVFAGHGGLYQPEPGRLVLDMGNQTAPGVIDHHHDTALPECTATLIVKQPGLVREHLAGCPVEKVEFWLHHSPDFDAIAGAWLAQEVLVRGALPPGAEAVAAYALRSDMATLPISDHPQRTPYGIMAGIYCLLDEQPTYTESLEEGQYLRDYRVLERGLELMDYLAGAAAAGRDLYDPTLFADDHPFGAELRAVEDDYSRYLADLAGGRLSTLAIPARDGSGVRPVGLLTVKDPTSALFKVWARQDRRHAPGGRGFVMTSVQYGNTRFVISVDPRAGLWLKGLGAALDHAETRKRVALGRERTGPARPGFVNSDPWYDGRAPIYNYTIVDAPRAGTVLTPEEVAAIVEHPETWTIDE